MVDAVVGRQHVGIGDEVARVAVAASLAFFSGVVFFVAAIRWRGAHEATSKGRTATPPLPVPQIRLRAF